MKNAQLTVALVIAAAAGLALYVVFRLIDRIKDAGDKAGDKIGEFVVDVFDLDKTDLKVNAGAMIPGLGLVPFDVIIAEGSSLKHEGAERFTFTYRGVKYRIVPPRRSDGNYDAVRA